MHDVDLGLVKQQHEDRHEDINDIEQAMETWNYGSVATRLRAKKIKRCCVAYISSFPVIVAIVLLATCVLLLVVLLDPRDDVGISNTPAALSQPKVEALMVVEDIPKPAEVKEEVLDDFSGLDLPEYGFLYTQDTSSAWLSYPEHLDANIVSFTKYDGINSVEECAAKCGELEAHAGGWGIRLEACWCRLSGGIASQCKEPCVKERFVEFSAAPLNQYEFCSESICSQGNDHSLFNDEYCEEVEFDNDECASRIKELESAHLPWIPEK